MTRYWVHRIVRKILRLYPDSEEIARILCLPKVFSSSRPLEMSAFLCKTTGWYIRLHGENPLEMRLRREVRHCWKGLESKKGREVMKGDENKRWSSAHSARCEYFPFLNAEIPRLASPFEPKEGNPRGQESNGCGYRRPKASRSRRSSAASCWGRWILLTSESTNQTQKSQEIDVIARLIILVKCSLMKNTFREIWRLNSKNSKL